jgi:uncharacterized membrane protein YczE
MKIHKIHFWVTLTSGILILLIGIILSILEQSTGEFNYHNLGETPFFEIHYQVLTGFGAILIGLLLLIFSIFLYKSYKSEKKEYENWKEE